jgi:tetratricopeptide (TPR) repeat protein
LQDTGEYDEAERLYRQTLALRRKLFGEEAPRLAITINNLATLLRDKGNYEEAETLFRQSLAMRRKQFGDEHPEVGTALHNLGSLLYRRGEYDQSENLQRQAIAVHQKSLKPDHWMIHRNRRELGACLIKLKRYGEAEEELLTAHAGLKAALGNQHERTQRAVSLLVELYEAWGKPGQAEPFRDLLKNKEKTPTP